MSRLVKFCLALSIFTVLSASLSFGTITCADGGTTCTVTTLRSCTTTTATCNFTVATTVAHSLEVVCGNAFAGPAITLNSVTGDGTWVVSTASAGSDTSAGSIRFAYNLNSTGGTTPTITCTFSAANGSSSQCFYLRFTSTLNAFTFDTGNGVDNSTACTSCTGVALTLTNTIANHVLIQSSSCVGTCSAINQSYTGVFSTGNGIAFKINVTVAGTTPAWTSTSGRMAGSGIAIFEGTGAQSAAISEAFTTAPAVVASAGRSAAISEAFGTSPSVATILGHSAPESEAFTTTPAVIAISAHNAPLPESFTTSPLIRLDINFHLAESFTTAPSVLASVGRSAAQPESVTTTPSVLALAGKSVSKSEAFTSTPAVLAVAAHSSTIPESFTTTPGVVALAAHSASIPESFTTTPSVTAAKNAGSLSAPLTEAFTTTPTVARVPVFGATAPVAFTTTPSVVAQAAHSAAIPEAIGISPTLLVQPAHNASVALTINTSDSVAAVKVVGGTRRRALLIG